MEQTYPKTMKSLQCMQQGYANVNLVTDAPTPKITGNNDDYFVIIKNLAASVNPVDYKACDYNFGFIQYPYKLGLDSCGLIVACGPKVDKNLFVPNKTVVYLHGNLANTEGGAFSEYTKHDSRLMTILPESLFQNKNPEQIYQDFAAIPTVAFTAYQAVVSKLKLPLEKENWNKLVFKPMKYILVTAAAGGVGSFCVQLLKMYKDVVGDNSIRIIGTCSGKNAEFVKSLGATDVIDYNTQNIAEEVKKITSGKGLDAWIDNVGEESCKVALTLLRHQGELVCIVGIGSAFANGGQFFAKATSVHLVALGWVYQSGELELMSEVKFMGDKMLEYYQKNLIKVSIQEVFDIQDAKKALDLNKSGHVRGKVVVKF